MFEKPAKTHFRLNLTPLIDIIFQLVIFFMLSTSFVKLAAIDVVIEKPSFAPLPAEELGAAPQHITPPNEEDSALNIKIMPDEIFLNNQTYAQDDFSQLFQDLRRYGESQKIILQAGQGANVQRLVDVIDALAQAGMNNVTIQKAEQKAEQE